MNKDKIESVISYVDKKKVVNDKLIQYKKEYEDIINGLKELSNDSDIKRLVIDNLHIEDNGEPRFIESRDIFSSSDGKSGEYVHKESNPSASFNPEYDDFEINDIIFNDDRSSFRIEVECIRRRKFLLYNMWEPDLYLTDWIKI